MTAQHGFRIESAGRFQLQIITPVDQNSVDSEDHDPSQFRTELLCDILGPAGFKRSLRVERVALVGFDQWSRTYAPSDIFVLPQSGTYDLTFRGGERNAVLTSHGAIVLLARLQPVGPAVIYTLAEWSGYVLIILSAVLLRVARARRTNRSQPGPISATGQ